MNRIRSAVTTGVQKFPVPLVLLFGAVVLVACVQKPVVPDWSGASSSLLNGERIYYQGANILGRWIPNSGGPRFRMMMDGRLACINCHGDDGRGGLHTMHMQVMNAPDIRISTLEEGADHGSSDGHGDEHATGYDLEIFRQAVVLGQHPDGDPLSLDMPRWQLEDDDLADLYEFLESLEP